VSGARAIVVDTGPLVALFDPSDADRELCKTELGRLRRHRLVTTLATITEATHLLAFNPRAQWALLDFVDSHAVEVEPFGVDDIRRCRSLMERYANVPMDFADATLVVIAERLGTEHVFSLDSDFRVYRIGRRAFRLVPAKRL
jgi:predicted nucleic acid-binding protein